MIDRLKHIFEQPFVFATGLAALVHSTWSLGTLFSGKQPEASLTDIQFWGWIVPAFLIAVALDIGQIATSSTIRVRGLTKARGFTFVVFAAATYFLQWLYIAHHMPALALGDGVRPEWAGGAQLIRDAALWLIPLLLPLSTLLYTFSDGTGHEQPRQEGITVASDSDTRFVPLPFGNTGIPAIEASISQQSVADIPYAELPPQWIYDELPVWLPPDDEDTAEFPSEGDRFLALSQPQENHTATCKHCGWQTTKDSQKRAAQSLNAHMRHCAAANGTPAGV